MLVAREILRLRRELRPADESHLSNYLDSASLLEMAFVFTGDLMAPGGRALVGIPAVKAVLR